MAERDLPARVQVASQRQEPLAAQVQVLLLDLPMPVTCCPRTDISGSVTGRLADSFSRCETLPDMRIIS